MNKKYLLLKMATYSNEGYRWAPTYFNGDLCRYLGVSPHKTHYKIASLSARSLRKFKNLTTSLCPALK